jgi:hypothetical protein
MWRYEPEEEGFLARANTAVTIKLLRGYAW